MHAEVLEFTQSQGLPSTLVPALESFISRLADSGILAGNAVTVQGAYAERDPVDLSQPKAPRETVPRRDLVAGRYEDLGRLGHGGMGEVRRVRDIELNRTLAMKTLHRKMLEHPTAIERFLDEAQATAQLQHPNIVPVHDLGRHDDGRLWFTMREVRGQTLTEIVRDVHDASPYQWEAGAEGWTFRRLMSAYLSVCRAVAYAHQRGVVHRDLKPSNVMVGSLGEVYVLDWGLAKIVGRVDVAGHAGELDPHESVQTTGVGSGESRTQAGLVVGTPAYMPPEQARGQIDQIDARSDVYALGAMLYEILSGAPPYQGRPGAVLRQLLAGAPPPVHEAMPSATIGFEAATDGDRTGPPLPPELVAACERAMSRDADARFQTSAQLAAEVEAWLDGARRREQALDVTTRALQEGRDANRWIAEATRLRAESEALLDGVEPWRPEEDKAAGWAKAEEADGASRTAMLRQLAVDQRLAAALQIDPSLPEAHAAVVERLRMRHAESESRGDVEAALRSELQIRTHLAALPETHAVRQAGARYLTGDGALSIVTDPPGAEVLLYRYQVRNRRLVEGFERSLGVTPLRQVSIPMGRYLCVLKREGYHDVRYPVDVTRLGHWDGARPGEETPAPVWLPPDGTLSADECYVPAGWFRSGGDPEAFVSHPARRLWCDALVVQRFPVTNRQYIAFLHDLVAHGREEDALRHVPRQPAAQLEDRGAMVYARTDDGGFALMVDEDGQTWDLDWPVVFVDWHGSRAYLEWLSERTGRPWRLPGELEWEKAARGVDGRAYPWGDQADPSWMRVNLSQQGQRLPAVVDSYPVDSSPYGVRGLAGNVRDWCLDTEGQVHRSTVVAPEIDDSTNIRRIRGGVWDGGVRGARSADRYKDRPRRRGGINGFRGVYRPVTEG